MCSFTNSPNGSTGSDFGVSSVGSVAPAMLSMYLWDVCKRGDFFKREAYSQYVLFDFVNGFTERVFQGVVIPPRFDKIHVFEMLGKALTDSLKQSGMTDSLKSVDPENIESIEDLAEQSRQKAEEQLRNNVEFLKQDIFPPILWMEISRLVEVFVDCMRFLAQRMKKWGELRPRRASQIKERGRLTKWMSRPFSDLANCLHSVFVNFLRVHLFMELISCEHESELFGERLWSFKDEYYENFEPLMFDLHNSIMALQQALFKFKPKKIAVDFSKPTGWAFKQLVQTVEI